MRIRSVRATLICMALVLALGAWQASTSMSDLLFPSDIFSSSRAHNSGTLNVNPNFFSTMVGVVPEGNIYSALKSPDSQGMSLQLPSARNDNWMNSALKLGIAPDISDNVALASYGQIIARFPNQSNIFAPYSFAL